MRTPTGFFIDDPAAPLILAHISYWNLTSGAGNALGTTIVCADLANEPSYQGLSVKVLDGNAAGQVRLIAIHVAGAATLTVAAAFTDNAGAAVQIVAGTQFVILSTGGGGGAPAPVLAPSIGLWMFGRCDPAMVASTITIVCPNLAGFPNDIFNREFWMQVIHNVTVPGAAPEREVRQITDYVGATGTFTVDAFSANVMANDLVAIFHESIMAIEILGFGTLDTSAVDLPADSTRPGLYAWENDDYFKGCLLMPTEGDCRFQPRPIGSYVNATGVFALIEPFSQAPGAVDYVIIGASYPVEMHRVVDLIFTLVNAMLTLQETGSSITTTGGIDVIYEVNTPMGVFEPVVVQLDMTAQTAAEIVVVRTNYRITPGALKIEKDEVTFVGVQDPALKNIELEPNRSGLSVTIERIAGGAIAYPFAVFFRS